MTGLGKPSRLPAGSSPTASTRVVVGNYRDPEGQLPKFVSLTIDAFLRAGLTLYNEVVVTHVGLRLTIDVRKQFESGHKLRKTHQKRACLRQGRRAQGRRRRCPVHVAWPEGMRDEGQEANAE